MKGLLLVDDQEINLRDLRKPLEAAGFEVSFALSLEGAVATVLKQSFDGFLLDLHLPVSEVPPELRDRVAQLGRYPVNAGQALGNWIRSRDPRANILYISSHPREYRPELETDRAKPQGRVFARNAEEMRIGRIAETVRTSFGW